MNGQNDQYTNYSNMPYDNTGSIGYQAGGSSAPGNSPEPEKKENGIGRKLMVSAACALVFGAVAGATMTGVSHMAGGNGTKKAVEQIEETVAAPELTDGTAAKESAAGSVDKNAAEVEEWLKGTEAARAEAETAKETAAGYSNLDVSAIVEKAMPSVVSINVTGEEKVRDIFGYTRSYETAGAGSGIIIGEDDDEYMIVTNNHVVANSKTVTVQFIDEESVEAEVKGTDSGRDVAVISILKDKVKEETRNAIKVAEVGDSDSLKVGQGVIAIGNALGYGQSVTVGYISAMGRTVEAQDTSGRMAKVENLLQTDAAINPGNSGGALLDMQGRVIGINESKSVDTTVEGMGYAIPISSVTELIGTLSSQKTREEVAEENRGFIGFQGQNVDQEASERFHMPVGVFVYKILEDSAAASSELQEQDIITKLDGMTVSTMEELKDKLTRYEKGEKITLTIERPESGEYVEKQVEITLGSQPESVKQSAAEEKQQAEEEERAEEGGSADDFYGLEDFFRNGGFQFRW